MVVCLRVLWAVSHQGRPTPTITNLRDIMNRGAALTWQRRKVPGMGRLHRLVPSAEMSKVARKKVPLLGSVFSHLTDKKRGLNKQNNECNYWFKLRALFYCFQAVIALEFCPQSQTCYKTTRVRTLCTAIHLEWQGDHSTFVILKSLVVWNLISALFLE